MSLVALQFPLVPHSRRREKISLLPIALSLSAACLVAPSLFADEVLTTEVSANEVQRSEPMRAHEGYFREHCVELEAGQSLEFRVATPHPVAFNIHHHTDTDTTYPVKQTIERELVATLPIGDSGEYCFMWKNLADYPADYPIELRYQAR